jgi:hypothetical protein
MLGPLDWSCYATTALLGAAAIALLWRAFLSDWARRRRLSISHLPRCPRCWYDMAGVAGLTCPECGKTARTARSLRTSRRRWRPAAAASLLLLIASNALFVPARAKRGEDWTRWVPSTVLCLIAGTPATPMADALTGRDREMWAWQKFVFDARQARSIPAAELSGAVTTRSLWPEGAPISFLLEPTPSMRLTFVPPELVATPEDPAMRLGTRPVGRVSDSAPLLDREPQIVLAPMPLGEHVVVFDVTLRRGASLRHEKAVCKFRVVAPKDCGITPVVPGGAGALIQGRVRVDTLIAPSDGHEGFRVSIEPWNLTPSDRLPATPSWASAPSGYEMAAVVEILDGERVVYSCDRSETTAGGRTFVSPDLRSHLRPAHAEYPKALTLPAEYLDGLTVRIRGDVGLAAANHDATHYWAGEYEGPLSSFLKREPVKMMPLR